MRLIDADEIIASCNFVIEHGIASADGSHPISAEVVLEVVKSLPSVQPERKKGKWIENSEPNQLGKNGVWYWKCSNCGHIGIDSFNFCPFCGADLRGEIN